MGKWYVRKTQEEFESEVHQRHPTINVLEQYVDARIKILFECTVCGYQWLSSPDNLLHHRGCPRCTLTSRGKKRRKTNEQFLKEMEIRHPELIINSEYISSEIKVNCTCTICGYTNNYAPARLTHGDGGCFICGNRKISEALTMPEETFARKLQEVTSDIVVCGGYKNASSRVDVECIICGHQWSPVAKSLLQGCGCPRCLLSHGEKAIRKYFDKNDIRYSPQKTFDGLVGLGNGLLSYDFYLLDYNLLIEYQGQYHDGTAPMQTEMEFLKQQEHDKRKREYATLHNIPLLEIWYWDFDNIETILNHTLHNLVTTRVV